MILGQKHRRQQCSRCSKALSDEGHVSFHLQLTFTSAERQCPPSIEDPKASARRFIYGKLKPGTAFGETVERPCQSLLEIGISLDRASLTYGFYL